MLLYVSTSLLVCFCPITSVTISHWRKYFFKKVPYLLNIWSETNFGKPGNIFLRSFIVEVRCEKVSLKKICKFQGSS